MASTGDPGTIPTLFQNIGLNYKGKNISLMTVSPQGDYAAVAGYVLALVLAVLVIYPPVWPI